MDSTNIPTLTEDRRNQLLKRQFQTAMAGSEALQIHLGKAYLGQYDRQHLAVDAIPMAGATHHRLDSKAPARPGLNDGSQEDDIGGRMRPTGENGLGRSLVKADWDMRSRSI
jgi:hypothetical protein